MTTKNHLEKIYTVVPDIKTVKEGEAFLRGLSENKVKSNAYVTPNMVRNRKTALRTKVMRLINQIKTRNQKKNWIELQFQEVPTGTVFYTRLVLSDDKADQTANGKATYGAKKRMDGKECTGTTRYALMKSSGDVCFVVSKGMDQGSMLTLTKDRIVVTRSENKVLMGSITESGSKCGARDKAAAREDDWAGI